jgi:hypothetical protein
MDSLLSTLTTLLHGEARVALGVTVLSLLAVSWPLTKGTILCWRARAATRTARDGRQAGSAAGGRVAELVREIRQSPGSTGSPEPDAFVRDAARQLVVSEYESSYAEPISMYSNLLPPIGFIGTTCGLAIRLYSMQVSQEALQLGGLALALSSTIFALVSYAILESIKIALYGRLTLSIDAGLRESSAA